MLPSIMLSSFPSLREKNLRTLYGSANNDRSPKGSVDEKIIPLVDLINRHPEYVTLSSCSGRVALFDPAGSTSYNHNDNDDGPIKGTDISGKGRGQWVYVTHDIEPNLGQSIIRSLKKVGQERLDARLHHNRSTTTIGNNITHDNNLEQPITFKHEPPLLHVGAASLGAGKKLLHIAKSICAMRESGLVVTDQRVTVELRTTGTLLCLPLMIQLLEEDESSSSVSLIPNEEYLQSLADMANERMVQNEILLKRLYDAVQDGLFDNSSKSEDGGSNITTKNEEDSNPQYKVTLQSLPPLSLWKTAVVAIPRNGHHSSKNDIHLLAFGGQGIGPDLAQNNGKVPSCRRWDSVFRLSRQDGVWSDQWDALQVMNNFNGEGTKITTSAGIFEVEAKSSIGAREGHSACVLPQLKSNHDDAVVVIFGGRKGGPLSPSNDLFLFMLAKDENEQEVGVIGKPIDIRGSLPEPRFGHTMSVLDNEKHLAVIAGGTGVDGNNRAMSLSSVYILSRLTDDQSECCSHFIWDRIQDMPSPRSYHSTFIDEGSNSMFVFGGIEDSDDPFGLSSDDSSNALVMKLPLYENLENDIITNIIDQPPCLIGSSAVSFSFKPSNAVLVVGGAKSPACSGSDQYERGPINIFTTRMHENGSTNEFVRAEISSLELIDEDSSTIDLGSCVHHCLVALPNQQNEEFADTVIVGGGVPSFSFGQSYARSYIVNVTRTRAESSKATAKTLEQDIHIINKNQLTTAIVSTDSQPVQEISGKSMTQVNVVYVEARLAREVKHELDQLGLLEKRYKLVKADDNLIAIPVTDTEACSNNNSLKSLIVRVGTEMAPFSSSSMSKMKQRPR